jgi:serine/threonine protein kinase
VVGRTISYYHIIEKLGEDGIGIVYKAEDIRLERTVALKFLTPHLVSDEEVKDRFEREAKAASALDHPNICTVHEIDTCERKTFIVMAFIEGEPLDETIARGPLRLKDALDIGGQVAKGLKLPTSKASSIAASSRRTSSSERTVVPR